MTDMDQFKATYIEECFELLEEMEELLLHLDEEAADLEELNAIFRCAHSIKGGAGAFGFNRLVEFTHVLEFLLDAMREGAVQATSQVTDALLKSVDVVKYLVAAAQADEAVPSDYGADLVKILEEMAGGINTGGTPVPAAAPTVATPPAQETKEACFYSVDFKPERTLFESGNEPLLIIRELQRLGEVKATIDVSHVPDLLSIDHEDCFLSWNIDVTTEQEIDAIKEAFEFVEDECTLNIEEFGAISMPAPAAEKDLSEEDEFGGVFTDALADINSAAPTPPPVSSIPAASAAASDNAAAKTPTVSSIRVDINKVDALVNMVGELVITQAMITEQVKYLPSEEFHKLIQGVEELSRHTRALQESVMAVRMQPVKSVFARMPRIVRDLSSQLNKDIRIETHGETTEIDKTVIEQLSDPLTHMIRNSVDHGIESPDVRVKNGKSRQGTIRLSADNSGGRIIIEIEDDGAGINRERVLSKAIEKKLVAPEAQLSNEEIDNLIFMAGFSTAEAVTNVSGRGVGMDVVKRNIEELGGNIAMTNTPGQGSKFSVSLPLTLAILDGMVIQVGKEVYIIPINNILESLHPKEGDIKKISKGNDVINVRGEFVPILHLYQVFNIPNANRDPSKYLVVLVESGRQKVGLVVDELIGQQQVVIKSLEENTDRVEGISGATILGDGNVSLILDVGQLQQIAVKEEKQDEMA